MSHQVPTAPVHHLQSPHVAHQQQFVPVHPMLLSHYHSMSLLPPFVSLPFSIPSSSLNTVSSTTTVDAESSSTSSSSGAATPITPTTPYSQQQQQQAGRQFGTSDAPNHQQQHSHPCLIGTTNNRTLLTNGISASQGAECTTHVDNDKVSIDLENKKLWQKFHRVTNEMVVTRTGRKMFPKLELRLRGLDPKGMYSLSLFMRQVDNFRYKYQTGGWSPAGQDDTSASQSNEVQHHDGACLGDFWLSQEKLCFDRVKLTNREVHSNSLVSLCSMHKYQPVVRLFRVIDGHSVHLCTFEPPETQFIAVTAYQCEAITRLKVEHNPFAKGFREGSSRKRTLSPSPVSDPIHPPSPPSAKRPLLCPSSVLAASSAMSFPMHFPLYGSVPPAWPSSLSAFLSSMANCSMSRPFAGTYHQQQHQNNQMAEFGKMYSEICKQQQQRSERRSKGEEEEEEEEEEGTVGEQRQ